MLIAPYHVYGIIRFQGNVWICESGNLTWKLNLPENATPDQLGAGLNETITRNDHSPTILFAVFDPCVVVVQINLYRRTWISTTFLSGV